METTSYTPTPMTTSEFNNRFVYCGNVDSVNALLASGAVADSEDINEKSALSTSTVSLFMRRGVIT
jgi:hypothetical protein